MLSVVRNCILPQNMNLTCSLNFWTTFNMEHISTWNFSIIGSGSGADLLNNSLIWFPNLFLKMYWNISVYSSISIHRTWVRIQINVCRETCKIRNCDIKFLIDYWGSIGRAGSNWDGCNWDECNWFFRKRFEKIKMIELYKALHAKSIMEMHQSRSKNKMLEIR